MTEIIRAEPYKTLLKGVEDERKIIYLTMGGSRAYGTNIPTSDTDIRGIALKTERELFGTANFEQFLDTETDTTIYAVDKFFKLALNCNPNIIELLGTRDDQKFLVSKEMKLILDNKDIFLSQRAIGSFGGYATAQLRRLENYLGRVNSQSEKEKHIFNTVTNMRHHLQEHYTSYNDSNFKTYIGKTDREEFETEIFVDINMKGYPLRDFSSIQSEMNQAIKNYSKIGKRNKKKESTGLDKHAMHLIRLYMMLLDILESGEVNTYREKEHGLLMDIRNGAYSVDNYAPLYVLLAEYEKKVSYAKIHTNLPDKPDYKKAEELLIGINKNSLRG